MAQGTTSTATRIDVSPEARKAAVALAEAVRAAIRDLAADGEPAAFGPTLERLARAGDAA